MAKQLTLLIVLFTINCFFGVDCFGSIYIEAKSKEDTIQIDKKTAMKFEDKFKLNTKPFSGLRSGEGNLEIQKDGEFSYVPWPTTPVVTYTGDVFQGTTSKYDESITWGDIQDIREGKRTLEDVRKEMQQLEQARITKNILITLGILLLIIGLVYFARNKKETNK